MSVDSNFNRQFIQIDFRLLDNPDFLQFVGRPEFVTYLILRRFIWRGGEHRLGLHRLYTDEQMLASSVGSPRIADMLGLTDVTRVSKHLAYLRQLGVIQKIRTGRENIYILGQWHKPPGWHVSKEFYFLENRFGVGGSEQPPKPASKGPKPSKSDLAQKANSDLAPDASQTWLKKPTSNIEENREANTVRTGLKKLPDQGLEAGESEYLALEILDQLGDKHSHRFYELVAAKVPEHVIRKALSEIKADGADNPAKLFTYRMNQYAMKRLRGRIGDFRAAA